MEYDFYPLNPYIWLIFSGAVAIVFLIVRTFHQKYPGYPGNCQQKVDIRSPDRAISPLHGEE